jgi:hypothetical protein
MGTLLRIDGWRVMIYSLDHPPAHVHLVSPDGRAKIALNCPDGPVVPIEARGIDAGTLKRTLRLIENERLALCHAWRDIHGAY